MFVQLSENEEAGFIACKKFIEAGHTKIGFIGAPFKENSPASKERYNGFIKACKKFNINFDEKYLEISEFWSEQAGFNAAKKLFSRCNDISAVFAVSDTLAYGVIEYLKTINKKVDDDVSIIGFDDDNMISSNSIILNTFRQNREQIAKTACMMLLDKINGKDNPEVVRIPTVYIEKKSVKKLN